MDSNNTSIDLDSSSVLSSTKNDLDSSVMSINGSSGSSDTEGPDSFEQTNDQYLTSLQSPLKDEAENFTAGEANEKAEGSGGKMDNTMSEVSTDPSYSASQLLSSADTTLRDSSIATELAAELTAHKMKLPEQVVEALGEGTPSNAEDCNGKENEKVERIEFAASGEADTHIQAVSPNKRPFEQFVESQISSGELSDVEDELLENSTPSGLKEGAEMPSKKARICEPDLPDTVHVLYSNVSGAKIYLIGTAHFSQESCDDVSRIIMAVQPDIVMVELCKQRTNILHLDEETILEEAQNLSLERSLEIIKQQGTIQGVMYLLLLSMSAHITKELGMAPGGEFRRAYQEAQKVPRCMVHLGDRPIGITLQRALSGLSIWQKLRLGFNILTSKDTITKEEVEKCKQRDLLENMLAEMAGEFPALSRVFVTERDLFLAHSLQMSADSLPPPSGASASGDTAKRVVVGVVGIGHVPGILENWGKVTKEQIREVVKVDPPSRTVRVVKLACRAIFFGTCCYGAYRLARIPVSRFLLAR